MLSNVKTKINGRHRHSNEIQEIITRVPRWLVRWGITMMAAILLTMLAMVSMISYPDFIKLPVTINALEPSVPVKITSTLKLLQLKINQGSPVTGGQILAEVADLHGNKQQLTAPVAGKVAFAGILQANSILNPDKSQLYIIPSHQHFYGEIHISRTQLLQIK